VEQAIALIITGPLVGIELGVAAVVNPLAARLPDSGFRIIRGGGSRWLGALMPFWYIAVLALLIVVAIATHSPASIVATAVMAAAILLTVTILVPINGRIGRWSTDADVDRALAHRWDVLHWLRVGMLAVVFVLLTLSGI
jgi:Domain of unknown function (DUF1772)